MPQITAKHVALIAVGVFCATALAVCLTAAPSGLRLVSTGLTVAPNTHGVTSSAVGLRNPGQGPVSHVRPVPAGPTHSDRYPLPSSQGSTVPTSVAEVSAGADAVHAPPWPVVGLLLLSAAALRRVLSQRAVSPGTTPPTPFDLEATPIAPRGAPWAMGAIHGLRPANVGEYGGSRGSSRDGSRDSSPRGSRDSSPEGSRSATPVMKAAAAVSKTVNSAAGQHYKTVTRTAQTTTHYTTMALDTLLDTLDGGRRLRLKEEAREQQQAVAKGSVRDRMPEGPYASPTLSREMQPWGYTPTSNEGWAVTRERLLSAGVRAATAERVQAAHGSFVVLDLRNPLEFQRRHVPGAKPLLLFRPSTSDGPSSPLRKAIYATVFFNQTDTEENPEFMAQLEATVPNKNAPIILVDDNQMGSIEPFFMYPGGFPSRSLVAAYRMVGAGYTNIRFMKGGFKEWVKQDFPIESSAP